MADLKISELPVLLPEDLEANDDLAVADYSASESRRVTTKGLVEKAVSDLIDDGTIPGVKIADASITATQIADNAIGADQLADDAIAAVAIGDGTITGAKLAADTITAANIAADAVTASELADDAVDTASIVDGAVTGAKIAADTITASNIAADAVGASELADNAVDTASIVNSAVTTDKLGAGAVTAIKIESGTITSTQIATGTIATGNIQDAAVTGGKIASGTITGSNIASATITAANIADNAIGADQLADDAIAAVAIGDGTITGTKIAADTITAANIATDAVGASELADDAVDTGAIVDGAVTSAKLATDAVGSTNIAADAVTSIKIAAGAVGVTQLADDSITNAKVASGVDGAKISDNTIAAAKLTTGALDRGLDRTSGSIGITNEIAPGTQNGITYNEQGLITSTAALDATDLPIANTTEPGAVIVASDSGLAVTGGGEISIANSITAATVSGITFDEFGSITAATRLVDTDLPLATNATVGGVIVPAGGGLNIDGSANVSLVDTGVAAGEYTKVTVNAKGVVTEATTLGGDDIPEISAALLTSGTIPIARLASNSITGEKLSNSSVCQFGGSGSTAGVVTFPVAQYTGQFFFDSLNGDLYIWDGNAWQPVTITSGEIIFAGTYDASTNLVASTTTVGAAAGLTAGSVLPAASSNNNQYYVVVSVTGTGTSPAPAVSLNPPDILISNGTTWELLDVSGYISSQQASNISVVASGGISSTDVQAALEELDSKKLAKAGGTITGTLEIGSTGALVFEGSANDGFETTIAVTDPTADRTITFPNVTGNVVTTGDSGTVTSTMIANGTIANADISATAAIAFSKLAALTGGHIIVGNSSNVPTAVAVSGDITLSNTGVASIASGAIVNADINASAAIAGSKIQAATTSNAGAVQLNNTVTSTSTSQAATANAVKTAYDLADNAIPESGGRFTGDVVISGANKLVIGTTESTGDQKLKIQGQVGNSNAGAIAVLARGNTPSADGSFLGAISFRDHEENRGAEIRAESDNAWSSGNYGSRLILATTALDGSAPLDRWEINRSGQLTSLADGGGIDCAPVYTNTTANAANVYVGSGGVLQRSTSSIKYKKDVETIEDSYADAILDCRPVWYRSICSGDCPDHSFWGFIAEEVAEIDPRLVHFKTVDVTFENGKKIETPCDPEPESVHYNRFVPHLVNLVRRQRNQIQSLEDRLAALEAKLQ